MNLEERLSALMDGECPKAELPALLDELAHSPALMARWERHCLTHDALAGVRITRRLDLADAVMAALDEEPLPDAADRRPVVVPIRPTATPAAAPAPVPTHPMRRAASAGQGPWRARLAGLAVAASITAVVAIGGRSLIESPAPSAVVASVPVAAETAALTPVSTDAAVIGSVPQLAAGSAHWADIDAETASTLNDLLLEHANVRGAAGMGSALGSARIAVRTVDFRSAGAAR